MTGDTFVTHCTRGVRLAQRTDSIIGPIVDTLKEGAVEALREGDGEIAAELLRCAESLAVWVQETSEVIVDLTQDYCDLLRESAC